MLSDDNLLEIFNFGENKIPVNSSGFWNLTAMCKPFNTRPREFLKTNEGKKSVWALNVWLYHKEKGISIHLDKIEQREDIPFDGLERVLIVKKGGNTEGMGTYGHTLLALRIASWLDPFFSIWVYSIVDKLIARGSVNLKEELKEAQQSIICMKKAIQNQKKENSYLRKQADRWERNYYYIRDAEQHEQEFTYLLPDD